MFQNSANLFVLKFKCAKFQKKKNQIQKNSDNFYFFRIFLKKSQCSKIPEIYLSWNSSVWSFRQKKILEKSQKFFDNFDFFQNFLKKSQMFQNSENLFVLKFKCAKFQTKKNSRKKWPLE